VCQTPEWRGNPLFHARNLFLLLLFNIQRFIIVKLKTGCVLLIDSAAKTHGHWSDCPVGGRFSERRPPTLV
jgi:hypothetical protein